MVSKPTSAAADPLDADADRFQSMTPNAGVWLDHSTHGKKNAPRFLAARTDYSSPLLQPGVLGDRDTYQCSENCRCKRITI